MLEIDLCKHVHERGGRIVRDEVACELRREMLRRRGMLREHREHLFAFLDAAFLEALAEHRLVTGLVHQRAEIELPGRAARECGGARVARGTAVTGAVRGAVGSGTAEAASAGSDRAADRPARDHLREFGDVVLGVAAIDAERVQLEDLAREVLVETELAATVAREPRRRRPFAHRRRVVEV